jgi:hypothetical protein
MRPPSRGAGGLPVEPAPALTPALFDEDDEVLAGVLAEIVAQDEDAIARGEEVSDLVGTLDSLLPSEGCRDLLARSLALSEVAADQARVLASRLGFKVGRRAGGPCPVCEAVHAEVVSFGDPHALAITMHALLREDLHIRRLGREVTRCRDRLRAAVNDPTWQRALAMLRAIDARVSHEHLVLVRWGYEQGLRRGRVIGEEGA